MGSSTEKTDSKGREKVRCRECNRYYHRLDVHISAKHPDVGGVKGYKKRYPGAPTISEYASGRARDAAAKTGARPPGAKKADESKPDEKALRFGSATIRMRDDLSEGDAAWLPTHDEGWIPGAAEADALEAIAHAIEAGGNVLIVGPPGCGKSTLARELAAIVNQPLRYIPFNGEMRVNDVMGGDQLRVDPESGQAVTRYEDGPLPAAAEAGHWVLFDEFDSAPSHVTFILHGALEARPKLTRLNGEPVSFDPRFRVIATANTLGLGDESGLYAGTAPMNAALLDRFTAVVRMGYPTADDETNILVSRTGLGEPDARRMVSVAAKVREAERNETTAANLSTRRLVMWAEMAVRMKSVRKAARYSVTNRLSDDDGKFVDGIIQRYFGGEV